jgi:hypothetical protein
MNLRLGVVNKRFTTKSQFNVIINSESTEIQTQTAQFADAIEQWSYAIDNETDPTYELTDTGDVSLQEFFSRPIKIASYSWTVGNSIWHALDPWSLFFQNKRVENRLVNYMLLRAKLHVRILINGNSFYYGRALVSYRPLPGFDQLTTSRSDVFNDIVGESQRPHIYLNPTTNQGGDIICPFIWPSNALRIPSREWAQMGEMIVRSTGPLKHANGATDPITISVFAWAEDVSLSVPTSDQPGALSPQAGPDEYDGPISRPAAAIGKIAGALATVPALAPYAMATQQVANNVGKMASTMGYTRPVTLGENILVPTPFPNSVNTDGSDTTIKLSMDPKQGLTVDPRTMGLGSTDEMTVKSISCRESFLTSFAWNTVGPPEAKLWSCSVSPLLWAQNTDPLSLDTEYHFPACAFATMPFRQWRGRLKYRFQVVCSAYHKGRMRVSYDPSIQLSPEYNTNYNYIVDLANTNDFTVEVGWGLDRPMMNRALPGYDPIQYGPSFTSTSGYRGNGVLTLYIVNELTSPNSVVDNNVEINVFVSTCDDFEVYNPSPTMDDFTYFPQAPSAPAAALSPQAGPDGAEPDSTEDGNAPIQDQVVTLNPVDTRKRIDEVFYGDPIVSFRSLLKRYNYSRTYSPILNTSPRFCKWTVPNFPFYRGRAPGAIDDAVGGKYNFNKQTLLNYLAPAYVCWRGSLRWRYHKDRGGSGGTYMSVTRMTYNDDGYSYVASVIGPSTQSASIRARQSIAQIPSTHVGAVVQDTWINPVLSVDLPYYSNQRFSHARWVDVGTGDFQQTVYNMFHILLASFGNISPTTMAPFIHAYVATGDDFMLGMFTGAPRMFFKIVGTEPDAI